MILFEGIKPMILEIFGMPPLPERAIRSHLFFLTAVICFDRSNRFKNYISLFVRKTLYNYTIVEFNSKIRLSFKNEINNCIIFQ